MTRGLASQPHRFALLPLLLLALWTCPRAAAQQPMQDAATVKPACGVRGPGDTRPRIGLALGGGGARGIAHISVLRKLETLRIPVDCIAGTSMGSLVGGLYASGVPVERMEQLVVATDWNQLFDDSLERKERSFRRKQDDVERLATLGAGLDRDGIRLSPGLLQGERVLAWFERQTLQVSTIEDFDRLPIPFRAVATDLNTGEAVVLRRGNLAMAMRASMSLPGIFQPFELEGRTLVDGGLANQVPVDVVRGMGADIVIAVDVGTPLRALDRDASLLAVVSQLSGLLTVGSSRRQLETLEQRDVLIIPALGETVATGDFTKAPEALAIGRQAADAATDRLATLSVDGQRYVALASQRPTPATVAPIVEFVRLDNQTDYADELLLSTIRIPTGQPLDPDAAEAGILRAYGLGTLSNITYEVVHEDDRSGVLIRARPKPQGPAYVQAGFTLSTDFSGNFESNLRLGLLFAPLSPYGAEGRVTLTVGTEPALLGEYYHPLDVANRYAVSARGGYEDANIRRFDADGNDIASYDIRKLGVELKGSRQFSNVGELAFGLRRATGRAAVQVGDPGLEEYDFDQGELFARFTVDQLDSLYFPRDGVFAQLGYTESSETLGSDSDFAQLDFDTVAATSRGRHSAQAGARYHVTTSGTLPIQSLYRLGGRGRLVGYEYNQLAGQNYAVLFTGYSYQLARLLGRSALVGGTLEYGNAWERRRDVAFADGVWNAGLYLGFDSWLGPVLFGVGWREGGEGVAFLEIGRPY